MVCIANMPGVGTLVFSTVVFAEGGGSCCLVPFCPFISQFGYEFLSVLWGLFFVKALPELCLSLEFNGRGEVGICEMGYSRLSQEAQHGANRGFAAFQLCDPERPEI